MSSDAENDASCETDPFVGFQGEAMLVEDRYRDGQDVVPVPVGHVGIESDWDAVWELNIYTDGGEDVRVRRVIIHRVSTSSSRV